MRQLALKIGGIAAVAMGALAISFGSVWAPRTLDLVYDGPIGWPFDLIVPFLPMFLIAFGALLLVRSR